MNSSNTSKLQNIGGCLLTFQPKKCLSAVTVVISLLYISLSLFLEQQKSSTAKALLGDAHSSKYMSMESERETLGAAAFTTETPPNTTEIWRHNIWNVSDPDSFGQIPHSEIFVREIFIDKRYVPARITVVAIAPVRRSRLYCHVIYTDGNKVVTSRETKDFYTLGSVPPYCYFKSYLIYCPLPTKSKKNPRLVGLSVRQNSDNLYIRKPRVIERTGHPKHDFGMCLPKIFGMGDGGADKIVEFVELYRILGIKHAVLYDVENSTDRVSKVVNFYRDSGFISIVPWTLPVPNLEKSMYYRPDYVAPPGAQPGEKYSRHNPYCVRRHAQLLSNFHCHLSSVHRYKYLAFPDLDEVFMPRKHRTLPELFRHLEKDGKFRKSVSAVFLEAFFCIADNNRNSTNNTLTSNNKNNKSSTSSSNNNNNNNNKNNNKSNSRIDNDNKEKDRTSNMKNNSNNNNNITLKLFSNVRTAVVYPAKTLKSPKTILKPDKTSVMTVHTVQSGMKGYHRKFVVSSSLATKNHYRVPSYCRQNSELITDNVIDPYMDELKHNVKLVKMKLTQL